MTNSPLRVLVFPCGSEIGLELADSLKFNKHFELVGVSSKADHGKFVFEKYLEIDYSIDDEKCIFALKKIIQTHKIDLIYPTMDLVLHIFKLNEEKLGVPVVTSPLKTTEICLSKTKTYSYFKNVIKVPKIITDTSEVSEYPVFAKPDIGYGSRGTQMISNEYELKKLLDSDLCSKMIITEFLPGKEFTVDCFTDKDGNLLFSGSRERGRISNGISVSSSTSKELSERFSPLAEAINKKITFSGAWFFQIKEDKTGEPTLLEVACRLAGTSSVHRAKGVNFAELSCYTALEKNVTIIAQQFEVKIDRALSRKTIIDFNFKHVYVDLDDTLIVNNQVNCEMISFLYACKNRGIKIHLITKHILDLGHTLNRFAINQLFDRIIHLKSTERKSTFIENQDAIFIDDSYSERVEVFENARIPVFSIDSIPQFLF